MEVPRWELSKNGLRCVIRDPERRVLVLHTVSVAALWSIYSLAERFTSNNAKGVNVLTVATLVTNEIDSKIAKKKYRIYFKDMYSMQSTVKVIKFKIYPKLKITS